MTETLQPAVLINLENSATDQGNHVYVCLDCLNTSYPEPFYRVTVLPFTDEETPVIGHDLCEVCNCDIKRI